MSRPRQSNKTARTPEQKGTPAPQPQDEAQRQTVEPSDTGGKYSHWKVILLFAIPIAIVIVLGFILR
jgi:hypothetical protein